MIITDTVSYEVPDITLEQCVRYLAAKGWKKEYRSPVYRFYQDVPCNGIDFIDVPLEITPVSANEIIRSLSVYEQRLESFIYHEITDKFPENSPVASLYEKMILINAIMDVMISQNTSLDGEQLFLSILDMVVKSIADKLV